MPNEITFYVPADPDAQNNSFEDFERPFREEGHKVVSRVGNFVVVEFATTEAAVRWATDIGSNDHYDEDAEEFSEEPLWDVVEDEDGAVHMVPRVIE